MAQTSELYWVTLNCARCGEIYRSIRPLSPTDRLEPSLFQGNGGPPTDERPTCPTCRRDLVLTTIPLEAPDEPAKAAAGQQKPPRPPRTSGLRVLFEATDDEQLLTLLPTAEGLLIVTTRRLALLGLEST